MRRRVLQRPQLGELLPRLQCRLLDYAGNMPCRRGQCELLAARIEHVSGVEHDRFGLCLPGGPATSRAPLLAPASSSQSDIPTFQSSTRNAAQARGPMSSSRWPIAALGRGAQTVVKNLAFGIVAGSVFASSMAASDFKRAAAPASLIGCEGTTLSPVHKELP